jgi:carotenoid 1,2-hydratase
MNAVLYRGRRKLWTFTERSLLEVARPGELELGPSRWRWEQGALVVRFDERSPLLGWRLRGKVRLEPSCAGPPAVALDDAGLHRWRPIAPRARIEVELEEPRLRLRGRAYHDMNTGEAPLDEGFRSWQWFHASLQRATLVGYDVTQLDGSMRERGWRFTEEGEIVPAQAGSPRRFGLTRWCIPRSVRLLPGDRLWRWRTLESSPFYARSLLRGELDGEPATVLLESLGLTRFRCAAVRALFYLRMRREVPWAATPPLGLLARLRGWR